MAAFIDEQGKTSEKMSDLVMEYVSQFIARDFYEAYEEEAKTERYDYVPANFDEKMYKRIAVLFHGKSGQNKRVVLMAARSVIAMICLACVAFTIMVLLNSTLRHEIFYTLI